MVEKLPYDLFYSERSSLYDYIKWSISVFRNPAASHSLRQTLILGVFHFSTITYTINKMYVLIPVFVRGKKSMEHHSSNLSCIIMLRWHSLFFTPLTNMAGIQFTIELAKVLCVYGEESALWLWVHIVLLALLVAITKAAKDSSQLGVHNSARIHTSVQLWESVRAICFTALGGNQLEQSASLCITYYTGM